MLLLLVASLLLIPACKDDPPEETPLLPLRINCGGEDYTDDKKGVVWLADKKYARKGSKYRFKEAPSTKIHGAAPKEVYRTVRRSRVNYHLKEVPDGLCLVRLHFMDGRKKYEKRSMQFWIEEQPLIQNFNIKEAAGSAGRAVVVEHIVQVKDGAGLRIKGSRGHGDDVFISAIEVLPAPAGTQPDKAHAIEKPSDHADALRAFAGQPVRLVWTRAENDDDYYQNDNTGVLMGFDTEDGRAERIILPARRSYAMPLLSPDGQRVVFTDKQQGGCFAVGFDGQGLREIAAGYASDIWRDHATGITWVYLRTGFNEVNSPIIRVNLDDPAVRETVWEQSASGIHAASWFTVSADGTLASDAFPWPRCGLADLREHDVQFIGNGCWPSLAPDNSGRYFHFMGNHTTLEFFDRPDAAARPIKLSTIPGWTGRKLYHPRWSNHPRYLTATAPQWMPETELYLGRFDAAHAEIEQWFRVTYNQSADFFGDAWFALAQQAVPATPPPHVRITASMASTANEIPGLVFVWENERAKNAVLNEQGKVKHVWDVHYEGGTRPNRWYGADIRQGSLLPGDGALEAVLPSIASSQAFSIGMDVTATSDQTGLILYLGNKGADQALLVVEQKGREVSAGLRGADGIFHTVTWGPWDFSQPTQIMVSYDQQELKLHLNGEQRAAIAVSSPLRAWQAEHFIFGCDPEGRQNWQGSLENIRLYQRRLSPAEITQLQVSSTRLHQSRPPATQIVVEAELLQASEPAEPDLIAPYTRSLTENLYQVKNVLSGSLPAGQIIVLQWSILGGKLLPSSEREEGKTYRLTLEPQAEHPELSGEHRSTDLLEVEQPVFYDAGS